jgi:hypothetical protein
MFHVKQAPISGIVIWSSAGSGSIPWLAHAARDIPGEGLRLPGWTPLCGSVISRGVCRSHPFFQCDADPEASDGVMTPLGSVPPANGPI